MKTPRQSGFTLIELMVTLSVAAVLLGIGVPSFADALRNSRISSQYNQVVRSLYLARSEAVKSSDFVVVCSRSAPEATTCGDKDDWTNGWIVFVDVGVDIDDAASVSAGDTIVSLEPALGGTNTVTAYASFSSGDTPAEVGHIRYRPSGAANWRQGGSIVICDTARGSASSRAVNVRLTGAVEPARPSGAETIPRDTFGAALDCGTGT